MQKLRDDYANTLEDVGTSKEASDILRKITDTTELTVRQATWLSEEHGERLLVGKHMEWEGVVRWFPIGIFEALPISPAVWRWDRVIHSHKAGMYVVADRHIMLCMAHLYRALRHLKLLPHVWHEMEWFLERRSIEKPFLRAVGPGADAAMLSRHFEMGMGLRPSVLMARTPAKLMGQSMQDIKQRQAVIDSGSFFVRQMSDRYQADQKLGFKRSEVIDVVLKKMVEKATAAGSKSQSRAAAGRSAISGAQLLQTYQDMLLADEAELYFDYIGLWSDSARLFTAVFEDVCASLPQTRPQPGSGCFAELTSALFMEAIDLQAARLPLDHSGLALVAQVLQRHIEAHGDKHTVAALAMTSRHTEEQSSSSSAPNIDPIASDHREGVHEDGADCPPGTQDPTKATPVDDATLTIPLGDVKTAFAASRRKRGKRFLRTR